MSAIKNAKLQDAQQATAIPFRLRGDKIEFCLVTSTSGRWIFPKGIINENETFNETALIEAKEEAGLRGKIVDGPLGCYEIDKEGKKMTVVAVLMQVTKVDEKWEEDDWRERQWLSAAKSLKVLPEGELRKLLEIAVKSIASI